MQEIFLTEVPDNSMAPDFRAGDQILVDRGMKPVDGCFVIAVPAGTREAILRKYESRSDGGFTLRAMSSDEPTLDGDSVSDAPIVGVVTERHRILYPPKQP